MSKKKSQPKVDPSAAIEANKQALAYQEKYTPTSSIYDSGAFGQVESYYDPNTKQISNRIKADPRLTEGFDRYLNDNNNYDSLVAAEQVDVDQKINDQAFAALRTMGSRIGRNSLAGERFASRFAKDLAYDGATRREDARARVDDRLNKAYQRVYNPYSVLVANSQGQMVNNNLTNLGQGGANIYGQRAQMLLDTEKQNVQNAIAAQQAKSASKGSAIGTGLGIAGSIAGSFFGPAGTMVGGALGKAAGGLATRGM